MSYGEAAPRSYVNIDPQGEMTWAMHDVSIDRTEGTLYLPTDTIERHTQFLDIFHDVHRIEEIQEALALAGQEELDKTFPYGEIGRGAHGTVYDAESYAVKAFAPTRRHGHLPEIRATILLEDGLRRIPQVGSDFIMRGVKLLAAYTPSERDGTPIMWAMEKITPVLESDRYLHEPTASLDVLSTQSRIPDERVRSMLYRAALNLWSVSGGVKFDDKTDNLLIERTPEPTSNLPGSVVKIDVQVYPGELQYY